MRTGLSHKKRPSAALTTRRAGRWLVGLGLLLGIAACTAGFGGDPGAAVPSDHLDDPVVSPLNVFLGFEAGDDRVAEVAEMERTAGRLTQRCMADSGFDYTPPPVSSDTGAGPVPVDDWPIYTDEWIERYGFGVTTLRFSQAAVGPNLVGYPGTVAHGVEYADPNEAYLEALTPQENEAYNLALYGERPEFHDGQPSDVAAPGCLDAAYAEAFDTAAQTAFYETFGDELESIRQRVEADPRVAQYRNDVAVCVQVAGFSWGPDEDVYQRFATRLADIGPDFSVDPFEAAGLDPGDMSQAEIDAFIREHEILNDADRAALAEIQAEEVRLATAALACDGGPLDEQRFLQTIQNEYEQRFLDANTDRLADFRIDR